MNSDQIISLVRAEFERFGHAFFENGLFDLNLIGLRSAENRSDLFDDTFVAIYRDGTGWQARRWLFTSDPGRPWLEKPMRADGCAILVPRQHRGAWKLGTHRAGEPDGHRALVQAGPLEIWRDNDRDNVADYGGPVSKGQFGINIHHAGVDSKQVGLWSAGCQVFKRTADHAELLSLCDRQAERGPSWANFSYTLVHLADAPELTPVALPIA